MGGKRVAITKGCRDMFNSGGGGKGLKVGENAFCSR